MAQENHIDSVAEGDTFLFTSESVGEGHPGKQFPRDAANEILPPINGLWIQNSRLAAAVASPHVTCCGVLREPVCVVCVFTLAEGTSEHAHSSVGIGLRSVHKNRSALIHVHMLYCNFCVKGEGGAGVSAPALGLPQISWAGVYCRPTTEAM